MTRWLLLSLLMASCGLQSFDVDAAAVEDGAAAAVERWPEVRDIVGRLDVFGLPAGDVESACRAVPSARRESCAAWPGSWFPLARARIYVLSSMSADETAACVAHELQHLRPSVWALPDACASHSAECWED